MKLYKILTDAELFSNLSAENFSTKYEADFVLQTLRHFWKRSPDISSKFNIVVLLNNGVDVKKWDIVDLNTKRKLFIIFDEKGRTPLELVEQTRDVIFHAHLSFKEQERKYPNLFHYPLGSNSFVPALPNVPISQRHLNVFFSGNLHAGRARLYQRLAKLPYAPLSLLTRIQKYLNLKFDTKFPFSYIRFTEGFSKGFSFQEYAHYLTHSKIIVSPPGISNPECFRHYEGLRAGCVVIAERLPVKPQFESSPVIEVRNWHEGFKTIRRLLNDPLKLDDLSRNRITGTKNIFRQPLWRNTCSKKCRL